MNVVHSGICWSARIARKDYHPEQWGLEWMCIFGQDRFDGELELVSEENRGSTFTVRLPLFERED